MSYYTVQDPGLGFSLKPPKWVRKLQPGKFLLPVAAVGAALLIPGVGGAVIGGLTAAARAAAAGAGAIVNAVGGASNALTSASTLSQPIGAHAPTITVAPPSMTPPPTPPTAAALKSQTMLPIGAVLALGALVLVAASHRD